MPGNIAASDTHHRGRDPNFAKVYFDESKKVEFQTDARSTTLIILVGREAAPPAFSHDTFSGGMSVERWVIP
jgi:hypothetical protein